MGRRAVYMILLAMVAMLAIVPAHAQRFGENCVATIQNRNVQVSPNGTFAIPNVPVDQGFYRLRIICRNPDGTTTGSTGPLSRLNPNGSNNYDLSQLQLGTLLPIPVRLEIVAPRTAFTTRGETVQLTVKAHFPSGSVADYSAPDTGTTYSSSNNDLATVNENGLVTVHRRGQVIISARNEGINSTIALNILIPNDADGDGMTDEFERANGLNLNDAGDAGSDTDNDGLTNLQEFQRGTNPRAADTDGDALRDGDEITRNTNPKRGDSDSDGLRDGQEVRIGTDPLVPDTDGDGLPDGTEVQLGLNARVVTPTTTVVGRVVNATGNPVQGASAVAYNIFAGITDATGNFSIPSVPTQFGVVTILARSVVNGEIQDGTSLPTSPVANDTTNVGTIQIGTSTGVVTGQVTDGSNRPVAGVRVSVTSSGSSASSGCEAGGESTLCRSGRTADVRTTTTDPTGRFRVTGMPGGTITVIANDLRTLLRGRNAGTLITNQNVTINVRLSASGSISGTVFRRDGATPAGAGVSVRLSGSTVETATTDTLGRYRFDFIPLGGFTVEASDADENRGRSSGNLTNTGQAVVANIGFLGRGTVEGSVQDGGGNPVANATVNLSAHGIFGQQKNSTTDGNGRYRFENVFVGPFVVSATSPITRLGGSANGDITTDGQVVSRNISLQATGSIQVTVVKSDGTTVVPNAQISIGGTALTGTTNAQGQFRVNLLPVGSYTVHVSDPATGDRGVNSAAISGVDQVANVTVTLNGQGRVTVTVLDGSGTAVPGAQVNLSGQTQFGGHFVGNTQADGTFTFERVLAGSFSVSAFNPDTQLGGSASGTVAVGATTAITVRLQAAGSISGTVFGPDGTTPVSNITVRLNGGRSMLTSDTGAYRFDLVPTGNHSVDAVDAGGNVRARQGGISVATQGEVARANLRLIGLGTVRGLVTNPDETPAAGVHISLVSRAPGFGRSYGTRTDVAGRYSIGEVPVGTFEVRASLSTSTTNSFGSAEGTIASDGQTVDANIQLSTSLIPVRTTLYDANNFAFDIRENGRIEDGTTSVFSGDGNANRGASHLELVSGDAVVPFTGSPFGTSEEGGREISVQQNNLLGLNVTRKVFVPQGGYFARFLEILRNPSAEAITVSVRVNSHYRFIQKTQNGFRFDREPRIISTQSGDTTLAVGSAERDRWVLIDDDDDGDAFLVGTLPPTAHVFDGNGALLTSNATFDVDFNNRFGRLSETWSDVTVPAGGTVALMHFMVQQTGRAAGQAAAERLVQMPAEALAGMSADEVAAVRNFNVPADLSSTLPALPSLTGIVTGRVFAADGLTTMPGSRVTLRSSNVLFGRTYVGGTDGAGVFSFAGRLSNGGSIAIPVTAFDVQATEPTSGILSPVMTGTFSDDGQNGSQDIVFSNTAIVQGTVRRSGGAVVSGGQVRLSGGNLQNSVTTGISAEGAYRILGVPAGTYTLVATIVNGLAGSTSAVLENGSTTVADISIQTSGGVQGVVRDGANQVRANLTVVLRGADDFVRTAPTDTGGRYAFTDVPIGSYRVEVFDPATNTAGSRTVNVVADAVATADLTLRSGGTVAGRITNQSGVGVVGAQIVLSTGTVTLNATSGANGDYTIANVQPGNFNIRVTDPVTQLRGIAAGSLDLSGNTVTVNIQLFAGGSVSGRVLRFDNTTLVPNAQVSINRYLNGFPTTVNANAQGEYSFEAVPVGSFTLTAFDPATGDRGRASNQVNSNGEQRVVNVQMNGLGTVVARVRDASGNLIPNANVHMNSNSTFFSESYRGTTGADGIVTFERVLSGNLFLSATDPATLLAGTATGTLAANATVNIDVNLQPAGSITGRVLDVDGTTPVEGVVVRLMNSCCQIRSTRSASDGSFTFNAIPLGSYAVEALDGSNRLRARESGLALNANGDVATRNLIFVGLGTVVGRVLNPDGTAAQNTTVQVRSLNTVIGGFFNAQTDAFGDYRVTSVPVGGFTSSVVDFSRRVAGSTSGRIDTAGQEVTANIQLSSNVVTMGQTLFDFNGFRYDIMGNGGIGDGTNDAYNGALNLSLFGLDNAGTVVEQSFNHQSSGTAEEGNREIAVRQPGIFGLNVTRKIYVPSNGYFARYLEVLENPGAEPITVSARVFGSYSYYNCCNVFGRVVTTSNGDTTVTTDDFWYVTDDENGSNPFPNSRPTLGHVVGGPGARRGINELNVNVFNGSFNHRWNNITVPAAGTVILMHFESQQTTIAGSTASVQRLVQLPPEALEGLALDEIANIVNFAVPADGVSTVPPLAAVQRGAVSGTVYEGDSTTIAPFANVTFRSGNLIFGKSAVSQATDAGVYSINDVPVDDYTVQATHNFSGIPSPVFNGSFLPDTLSSTRNIAFTNTGILRGTIRTSTGGALPEGRSGTVRVFAGNGLPSSRTVSFNSTGEFRFPGLPAGAYNMRVRYFHPQGSSQDTFLNPTVTAGVVNTFDVTLPPTGTVTGTVVQGDGVTLSPNTYVEIRGSFCCRSTQSDANGQFTFTELPPGTYRVDAYEPNTNIRSSLDNVQVAANATTTVRVQLAATGTVVVTVNHANGTPASGSNVYIRSPNGNRFYGTTDANGTLTAPNVPIGSLTVTAYHPQNGDLSGTSQVTLSTHGQQITATVTLPAVTTVSGVVTFARGVVAANSFVFLEDNLENYRSGNTDSEGRYTLDLVAVGRPFTITARHPQDSSVRRVLTNITPPSTDPFTQNLVLPATAGLRVTVLNDQNTGVSGARLEVRDTARTFFRSIGTADANGVLTVNNPAVAEGPITVRAFDGTTFAPIGNTNATIVPENDGNIVDITITAPVRGTVTGTVTTAGGQVLAGSFVSVVDVNTDQQLGSASTDANGVYTITDVGHGSGGVRVTARLPNRSDITASVIAQITTAGSTVTVNLVIPVGTVRGTVRTAAGAAVPFPNVFLTHEDAEGNLRSFSSSTENEQGEYTFQDIPLGRFFLTAQGNNGLTRKVQGAMADVTVPVVIDLNLPGSGTISGTVRDSAGQATNFPSMRIASGSNSFTRFVNSTAEGTYSVSDIGVGPVALSVLSPGVMILDTALTSDGQTLTQDLNLPALSTITGTLFAVDGTTPLSGINVQMEMRGLRVDSTSSHVSSSTITDANGVFTFTELPPGEVLLTAQTSTPEYAARYITTQAGQTANTTLRLGTGAEVSYNLDGADGFRYDVQCNGELSDGGTVSRNLGDAFDGVDEVNINDRSIGCFNYVPLQDNARTLVFGPMRNGMVKQTRKVFVPTQGGYARFLDILENPGAADITVTMTVYGDYGSDSSTIVRVSPASTGRRYVISDDGRTCCDPALGQVWAGNGDVLLPTIFTIPPQSRDDYQVEFQVTIPAGQKVALMHFWIQRNPLSQAAIQEQVDSLMNMTDPNMFLHMTAEERSIVKNFNIPQQ